MITAIFVLLILATVSMLVLNLSATTSNSTTTQYRHEQAALYAKSYTELAIMSVLDYNRTLNSNCVETISGNIPNLASYNDGSGYKVTTDISYIGNGSTAGTLPPCTNVLNTNAIATTSVPLGNTPAIIVDVYVSYKDPEHVASSTAAAATAPDITYHRRTLQKI